MNDMSSIIVPKSDQINADDLIAGPRTITIASVDIRPGTEQPVSIHYDDRDNKVWRPCKSMSRVLVAAWGADAKVYSGRSVTLYRDPKVKWGGMEVGGIRISHLSDIPGEMPIALTATKGKRVMCTIRPLARQVEQGHYTLDDARADIDAAEDIDSLKATWQARRMAPHRDRLTSDMQARKAILEATGRPDEDHGDQHDGSLDTAKRHLASKVRWDDVLSLREVWIEKLDPVDHEEWTIACDERIAEIKAA